MQRTIQRYYSMSRNIVLLFLLLPLVVSVAQALPGGIVGRTLAPSCGACHGPASASTLVTMTSSSGTFTTAPGGALVLSMVVSHSSKVAAGMNVAVHDLNTANVGTLSVDANAGLRESLGEITHNAPKLFTNGSATFTFTWTAPTTPGTYILRGSGNAVDLTGGSNNDEFNYLQNGPIYVNVTGQVGTPSILLPTNASISVSTSPTLSWTSVSGAVQFEYQLSTSSSFTVIVTSGTVNVASVTLASLQNGVTYYWRVRALSQLSTSAYVSAGFTTVSGPPTSLNQPVVISPSSGALGVPTTATLLWSVIPEALQYEYQISTKSNYSPLTASGVISATGATVTGLAYNTLYYWRVRSKYGNVLSAYRTATFTTVAGQPPVVVFPAMHAIDIPATAATIRWSTISDAAGYSWQLATQSTFTTLLVNLNTTSTSATLPVLQKNTQYFWRVRAYGTAMGTTPYTTANFVTEVPRMAVKLRIENLAETTPKSNVPFTVMLRTNNNRGATANVTKATVLSFSETHPLLTIAGGTTTTLDIGAHVTTLSLVVYNASTASVAGLFSNAATTTAGLTATTQTLTIQPLLVLPQVALIAPVSTATSVPVTTPTVLSWKAVEGATLYSVQVATTAGFTAPVYNSIITAGNPFATTATAAFQLQGPTQYWWRVQAVNNMTTGTWSDQWNFITVAPFLAPVLVAPANGVTIGAQSPALSWQPVGTPSQYRIQVSTSATFASIHSDTTLSNVQSTADDLVPQSQYWWRVKAVGDSVESAWSPAWSLNTQPLLLVHPLGGEWLLARSSTSIVWTSTGNVGQVRIEFSGNNGGNWQTVTSATGNTGNYSWSTPPVQTTEARIRLTEVTNATVNADSPVPFNIFPPAPLNVRFLLEGSYTNAGMMTTLLNSGGLIPLTDPYEGQVKVATIPANVTDWVQLEFRNVRTPAVPGITQSLLLRNDGQVVAADGSTSQVVDISRITPGEYRLVVRHRNHLAAMSATTLTISVVQAQPLDLSTNATSVVASFQPGVKTTADQRLVLTAGDVNVDTIISAIDRVTVRNHTGQTGYTYSDISLDGLVNAADRIIVMNNKFLVSQVP